LLRDHFHIIFFTGKKILDLINFNNLLDSLNIDNKNNPDEILNILEKSNFKITIENYTKSEFDSSKKKNKKANN